MASVIGVKGHSLARGVMTSLSSQRATMVSLESHTLLVHALSPTFNCTDFTSVGNADEGIVLCNTTKFNIPKMWEIYTDSKMCWLEALM